MKIVNTKTICDRCGEEIHGLMPNDAVRTRSLARIKTLEVDRYGYIRDKDLRNEKVESVIAVFEYKDKRKEYDLCKSCGKELKRFLENK